MSNISQAVKQLHEERKRVQAELSGIDLALQALQGYRSTNGSRGPRRTMSVAARRRIAEAQRARWAKWKRAQK